MTFTGRVTDAELAAWYGAASAFATMSEHEGIGIPLLEAMAHDVPVVARSWAAIPETLAGAGLLLPAEAGALLVAEALECVISDEGGRKLLIDGAGNGWPDSTPSRPGRLPTPPGRGPVAERRPRPNPQSRRPPGFRQGSPLTRSVSCGLGLGWPRCASSRPQGFSYWHASGLGGRMYCGSFGATGCL